MARQSSRIPLIVPVVALLMGSYLGYLYLTGQMTSYDLKWAGVFVIVCVLVVASHFWKRRREKNRR